MRGGAQQGNGALPDEPLNHSRVNSTAHTSTRRRAWIALLFLGVLTIFRPIFFIIYPVQFGTVGMAGAGLLMIFRLPSIFGLYSVLVYPVIGMTEIFLAHKIFRKSFVAAVVGTVIVGMQLFGASGLIVYIVLSLLLGMQMPTALQGPEALADGSFLLVLFIWDVYVPARAFFSVIRFLRQDFLHRWGLGS